jgi:hypothetical protein
LLRDKKFSLATPRLQHHRLQSFLAIYLALIRLLERVPELASRPDQQRLPEALDGIAVPQKCVGLTALLDAEGERNEPLRP